MSRARYSVALKSDVARKLSDHLLQHITQERRQEDMCFALWRPSTGRTRTTALLTDIILPRDGERVLHGGASFLPDYVERVIGGRAKVRSRDRISAQSLYAGLAADEPRRCRGRATLGSPHIGRDRVAARRADHGD